MIDKVLDDGFGVSNAPTLENVEFAGFWIRVGATLIDFLVLLPLVGLGIYNSLSIKSIPLMILITLLSALYKPLMEYRMNATVGKMAVKIRLVNDQMQGISLEQAILRYVPWLISNVIAIALNFEIYSSSRFADVDSFVELNALSQGSTIGLINSIYGVIFLIILLTVAFDMRKQGLHDKLANTYVIKKDRRFA